MVYWLLYIVVVVGMKCLFDIKIVFFIVVKIVEFFFLWLLKFLDSYGGIFCFKFE